VERREVGAGLKSGRGPFPTLLTNLPIQLEYYRERGVPLRMGKAPEYARKRGASDRMAAELGL
jgi:hypothetical protein